MRCASLLLITGCAFHAGASGDDAAVISDGPAVGSDGAGHDGGGSNVLGARKKPITIAKQQVTGMLASFPVWIDVTDPQIAASARADGADLFFTDASGSAVPYEIASWDAASSHLTAWVSVASLGHSADTLLYLRYGTTAGVAPPAPATVFAAYAAVWHFDDSLSTPAVADALGAHWGTAMGLGATRQVAGKLGGAFNFDGASMQVTFTNMLQGATPHTISAWVSQRTASNFDALVVLGTNQLNESRWFYTAYTTSHVAVGLYSNDIADTGAAVQNAGWHLLHWVFDGKNKSTIYLDGASVGNFTHPSGNANTMGTGGWIGYAPSTPNGGWGADDWLNGMIDEVRISTAQESAEWIATEYANQSSPATFYSVGADEPAP